MLRSMRARISGGGSKPKGSPTPDRGASDAGPEGSGASTSGRPAGGTSPGGTARGGDGRGSPLPCLTSAEDLQRYYAGEEEGGGALCT